MSNITWANTAVTLGSLQPWAGNPKRSTKKHQAQLAASFDELGQFATIAIGPDGEVYDGHQRLSALLAQHGKGYQVEARQSSRPLTEQERRKVSIYSRQIGAWDWDILNAWEPDELTAWGFDGDLLSEWGSDYSKLGEMLGAGEEAPPTEGDAEPQTNRAEELRELWGVELGQMWAMGEHRLICGDCTDRAVVERVMGGEKAELVHADPPYGMGKEKDGIANDNLYREKLDVFQMAWWKAQRPFLADNGSAYIWGNAEDLWRLWYCGGLKDSERLTFRNDILWDQESGVTWGRDGMAGLRQYAKMGEHCFFFMLGEQGFNNNADNYWEGWEPVRAQLKADCDKMGWGAADIKRICGVGMYSHWFTKSQWTFIPEEHYKKLQAAAREHDAFKREHDELKREHDELKRDFYATRAYFDNTHDNMTDVWKFQRVTGDDRHNHATPKPVEMIARAIKSSTPEGAAVYVPFGGTCPEIIACQNLARRARAVEISPAYCAVILQRAADAFPGIDIHLIEDAA